METKWLDGFAVGFLSSAIGIFGVLAAGDVVDANDEAARDYLLALLSAAVTGLGFIFAARSVGAQISHGQSLEEDRRKRALRAALAGLPLALSEIMQVSGQNIKRHFMDEEAEGGYEQRRPAAKFSDSSISALKEFVLHSSDHIGDQVLYIMRVYQIILSRDRDFLNGVRPIRRDDVDFDNNVIDDVMNWSMLRAAAANMFVYARGGKADVHLPSLQEAESQLSNVIFQYQEYEVVMRYIEAANERGYVGLRFFGTIN